MAEFRGRRGLRRDVCGVGRGRNSAFAAAALPFRHRRKLTSRFRLVGRRMAVHLGEAGNEKPAGAVDALRVGGASTLPGTDDWTASPRCTLPGTRSRTTAFDTPRNTARPVRTQAVPYSPLPFSHSHSIQRMRAAASGTESREASGNGEPLRMNSDPRDKGWCRLPASPIC
jgi:hypothetical protein